MTIPTVPITLNMVCGKVRYHVAIMDSTGTEINNKHPETTLCGWMKGAAYSKHTTESTYSANLIRYKEAGT